MELNLSPYQNNKRPPYPTLNHKAIPPHTIPPPQSHQQNITSKKSQTQATWWDFPIATQSLLPQTYTSTNYHFLPTRFQRLQPARGGTAQRKIFLLANWSHLIHPAPSSSRSSFFMESSQSCAATLTHHSTEPLTTGPDYDPLLLLLALAGDVHPNPGPPRYPCSVCFKNVTSQGTSYLCTRCSHWVHSRCSGLRNASDYRKANGWICTACMTPPQSRAPLPPPTPAHMPTISDKTFNILQWNANGIGSKQTELSIFLEAHNVKVEAIQESKLTAKSRSPNIQNYTLVRQDRRLGPGGGLLFSIHNSVSFTRKPLSTMSKNDPPPRRTVVVVYPLP